MKAWRFKAAALLTTSLAQLPSLAASTLSMFTFHALHHPKSCKLKQKLAPSSSKTVYLMEYARDCKNYHHCCTLPAHPKTTCKFNLWFRYEIHPFYNTEYISISLPRRFHNNT
jgi:hypothetical protein